MAFRALISGQMLELSGGQAPSGMPQPTRIEISYQGKIYGDLGPSMTKRYVDDDPFMRSLVEYGVVEHSQDDEGNPVEVFVPRNIADDSEIPSSAAPDVLARAEEAEKQNAELRTLVEQHEAAAAEGHDSTRVLTDRLEQSQSQVADLEALVAEREQEIEGLKAASLSYDDLSVAALAAEVGEKKIPVTGSGANGKALKKDYVAALEGLSSKG